MNDAARRGRQGGGSGDAAARGNQAGEVKTTVDVLELAKVLHRAFEAPQPWPWDVLTEREQARWLRVAKAAIDYKNKK